MQMRDQEDPWFCWVCPLRFCEAQLPAEPAQRFSRRRERSIFLQLQHHCSPWFRPLAVEGLSGVARGTCPHTRRARAASGGAPAVLLKAPRPLRMRENPSRGRHRHLTRATNGLKMNRLGPRIDERGSAARKRPHWHAAERASNQS